MASSNTPDDITVTVQAMNDILGPAMYKSSGIRGLDDILGKQRSIQSNLLNRRLPIPLNRVICRTSKIHGKGVFATRDISVGEIITFYPGDYLRIIPSGKREGFCKKGYIHGLHVPQHMSYDKLNSKDKIKLEMYLYVIDRQIGIMGSPSMINNPAYLGHMCNDGATSHRKSDLSTYIKITSIKMNGITQLLKGSHLAIVACRPITKGDEILISYGPMYWGHYYN